MSNERDKRSIHILRVPYGPPNPPGRIRRLTMRIGELSFVAGGLAVLADLIKPELFTPQTVRLALAAMAIGLVTRLAAGRAQYPHQDVLAGDTLLSKTDHLIDRRTGGMNVPYSGDNARRRGRPK